MTINFNSAIVLNESIRSAFPNMPNTNESLERRTAIDEGIFIPFQLALLKQDDDSRTTYNDRRDG